MTSNIVNKDPYLRTTREFPEELHQLSTECNRAYRDTADCVNTRTIGIYPTNNPAVTGDQYFLKSGTKQQTLRQVYLVTPALVTSGINHNVKISDISQFIRCFGSYTDGTNCYGFIYGSTTAISGQISFYITKTQIVFVSGGGAPTLTSGRVVIEWLSSV